MPSVLPNLAFIGVVASVEAKKSLIIRTIIRNSLDVWEIVLIFADITQSEGIG